MTYYYDYDYPPSAYEMTSPDTRFLLRWLVYPISKISFIYMIRQSRQNEMRIDLMISGFEIHTPCMT
jgi:hypothetical protein